jgi:hypothetical protein
MARLAYSDALAEEICRRIITRDPGTETLRTVREICADDDMPSESTVYKWLSENAFFAEMYARTREARAHMVAEEIIQIADSEPDPNKARIRIDARKWWAGKANAKHYGERSFQDVNTTVVTINVAFEDYIRSLNEGATEHKVIDGTLATEAGRVESLPAQVRQGSLEGGS